MNIATKLMSLVVVFTLTLVCVSTKEARAQSCIHIVTDPNGGTLDNIVSPDWCKSSNQAMINNYWHTLGFVKSTWEGLGFSNLCSTYTLLNRVISSIYTIQESYPENGTTTAKNAMRYYQQFSMSTTRKVRGRCEYTSNKGGTMTATLLFSKRIDVYTKFANLNTPVTTRAALWMHEVRHNQNVPHTGSQKVGRNGTLHGKKDYQWEDYGAWYMQVAYLVSANYWGDFPWAKEVSPDPSHQGCSSTSSLYTNLLGTAESIMASNFDVTPNYVPPQRACAWALEIGQ